MTCAGGRTSQPRALRRRRCRPRSLAMESDLGRPDCPLERQFRDGAGRLSQVVAAGTVLSLQRLEPRSFAAR